MSDDTGAWEQRDEDSYPYYPPISTDSAAIPDEPVSSPISTDYGTITTSSDGSNLFKTTPNESVSTPNTSISTPNTSISTHNNVVLTPDGCVSPFIHPPMQTQPQPILISHEDTNPIPANWTPREKFITALWAHVKTRRIVQVQGSSTSGKTVTCHLLQRHININDPDYHVISLNGWKKEDVQSYGGYVGYLTEMAGYPQPDALFVANNLVILIDEAQEANWDNAFMLEFLKLVEQRAGPCVVLFGPSSVIVSTIPDGDLTPDIRELVTLRRSSPGWQNGRLTRLTEDELNDLISKVVKQWDSKFKIGENVRVFILELSKGHVGSALALLRIICDPLSCEPLTGMQLNIPLAKLVGNPRIFAERLARTDIAKGLVTNVNESYVKLIIQSIVKWHHIPLRTLKIAALKEKLELSKLLEIFNRLRLQGCLYNHFDYDNDRVVWVFPSKLHHW
ncbi:hypothetical protein EDC01DRAFT_751958 [Geopyxis carbonaria]|nr:hypothetical protein EDC01DRAFT_751958 [Geopyxis carbonaria]